MNLYTTSLPVSQRIKELVGEQIHTVYSWRRTVSFTLPEQEFVENPYRVVLGDHWNDDFYPNGKAYPAFPAVLLSELPEVLKKMGEIVKLTKLGDEYFHEDDGKTYWDFHVHCPVCGDICANQEECCPDGCQYQDTETVSWLYHYLKCCRLHALGQNVDDYLMELLK